MTFAYLASPYSSSDPSVVQRRFEETRSAAAWLLERRIWVCSPIVHCHDLAQVHKFPTDAAFWYSYNAAMIGRADLLYILAIDGWRTSKGIWGTPDTLGEVPLARQLGLDIMVMEWRPDVVPVTYSFQKLKPGFVP